MSDEEITYTAVRFHKTSSGPQNAGRPAETQGPREDVHRKYSISWHRIAILLGILSFILLVAVAVLVNHIFQYRQEKHELQKTLSNLHQEYSTMQNDSYLCEENLRNKSMECKALQGELDTLTRTLNRCSGETTVALDCQGHKGKIEGNLTCYGIKCYYLIEDKRKWSECHQTCQGCSLSLLKIHDDDELKFIRLQMKLKMYWIGLSYDINEKKWQWIDGQPSKLNFNITNLKSGRCAFLSKTRIDGDSCDQLYNCICEKRLDKFIDSSPSDRT